MGQDAPIGYLIGVILAGCRLSNSDSSICMMNLVVGLHFSRNLDTCNGISHNLLLLEHHMIAKL